MDHHFNTQVATKYGVLESIFLNNIAFWILFNKANNKNFHDGRYWTFNTAKAFSALFPYWTNQNLRTIIKSCLDQGLIMIGNYNKRKSDRTLWYALTDLGLSMYPAIGNVDLSLISEDGHLLESTNEAGCGLPATTSPPTRAVEHLLESTNPFVRSNTALPDITQDNKQKIKDKRYCPSDDELKSFEQVWNLYPRKQKRKDASKIWVRDKLHSKSDEIVMHLMKRTETEWKGRSENYIPLLTTFLNGEGWNDKIIANENVVQLKPNLSQHQKNMNYVMEKILHGK